MAKVMFWYGAVAVTLQMVSFSYLVWGLFGAVLSLMLFPIAMVVTSIGALVVFGSPWGIINLIILVIGFASLEKD